MQNKYKKLIKNSTWTIIGNSGSKLLGFLLLPLYTKWLGTEGFGESDLVSTYSSLLVCIMTMCVAEAIFVFTKNEDENVKKSFFSSSLLFIFILLCFWLLIWKLLDVIFSQYNIHNSFSNNLWLILGIVISTFLQQYTQQFVLSIEKIKIYSFTGIIHSVLLLFCSYIMIPSGGVHGYIMAIILANCMTALYSFLLSKSYFYFSIKKFKKSNIHKLLKYSIPLIPNSIMWWLVSAINRPLMEYHMNFSDIGIFAVANKFPSLITMVFMVFSTAWNISLFEEFRNENFASFYKRIFKILFLLVTIVASVVIIFSQHIIEIFADSEFIDAWKYMIILIVGAELFCMSSFFGTNFGVVKKSKYFFYSSMWGAMTSVAMNFLLIPLFKAYGAAMSIVISFLVMMVARYIYSKKIVRISLVLDILVYTCTITTIALVCLLVNHVIIKIIVLSVVLILMSIRERMIIMLVITSFANKLQAFHESNKRGVKL